jgi:hypothetical protein
MSVQTENGLESNTNDKCERSLRDISKIVNFQRA